LERSLRDTGKDILGLDFDQLEAFAGNMLEVHDRDGQPLLVMSASAWGALQPAQRQHVERHTRPVVVNIDNIERIGGGSARCRLADVHFRQTTRNTPRRGSRRPNVHPAACLRPGA
ncbi:arginine deiminase-related protein, partial [Klebsiella pneumoniae]|uniref:arginine deiminase-related protein n=1 Tax=Klebsiella pneumoniae TaxID=573 RepID=UPI00272EFC00